MDWVAEGKRIGSTFGFEAARYDKGVWSTITENPVYPRVDIMPVKIDADAKLYKKLAIGLGGLVNDGQPHVYRIDMSASKDWNGMVQSVKFELGGHYRGDTVTVSALGVSKKALDRVDGEAVVALNNASHIIKHHDRMAIWQDASVRINDTIPTAAFMSYVIDRPSFLDGVVLAKIIPGLEIDGEMVWACRLMLPQARSLLLRPSRIIGRKPSRPCRNILPTIPARAVYSKPAALKLAASMTVAVCFRRALLKTKRF